MPGKLMLTLLAVCLVLGAFLFLWYVVMPMASTTAMAM